MLPKKKPTGLLPTTFDPFTGISIRILEVYQKPHSRGRIHIIYYTYGMFGCVVQANAVPGRPCPGLDQMYSH